MLCRPHPGAQSVVLAGLVGLAFDISLGVVALIAALIYAVFGIVRSRSLISGMTHAQSIGPDELRPLRRLVENVSIGAGLPVTPELRIVDDAAPNAFAAGLRPTSSYVGVTTGLLRTMPKRELEAVLAHEISHIRNRDTYLMTMATVFAGVIALIADIGFRSMAYGGRSRKGGAVVAILAIVGFLLAPYAALLLRMVSPGAGSTSRTPARRRSSATQRRWPSHYAGSSSTPPRFATPMRLRRTCGSRAPPIASTPSAAE